MRRAIECLVREIKRARPPGRVRSFGREEKGLAAIEFALIAGTLSIGLLNAVDVGVYAFKKMEVENASQMGAQAAWKTCDTSHIPATTACSGLSTAVTQAVQATSLGTHVTLASGYPSEGYYCVNSSGALVYVAAVSSKPSSCSSVGGTSAPADYIVIQTTYTYAPIFPGVTVASTFATTLTKTTYMRLG
ncbi:MAG TPA: TadE/TadG family type IV pilus assembly protein [Caulobacteraceae bacterium]|jgi:Flp pilus assembly protein TadG|nr:TadE/TadG family type IV pilus assembly protein [Caulobacteraceae bacterium]